MIKKNFILLTLCFPLVLLAELEPETEQKKEEKKPWEHWVFKHWHYLAPTITAENVNENKPYDDFVNSILPKKTVQQHIKEQYKRMHREGIEEVLQPLNLPDTENKVNQFYELKKQIKKKDQRAGLKINYAADIPEQTRSVIEDICKKYNIRSRFSVGIIKDSDKEKPDVVGFAKTETQERYDFRWVDIKKHEIKIKKDQLGSDVDTNRILIHEIAGHLKDYDSLDGRCLAVLYYQQKKYSYEELVAQNNSLKKVPALFALHEWGANLKPMSLNKEFASKIIDALELKRNNGSDDLHPPTELTFRCATLIGGFYAAQSRWIWGPKGYEQYGDPAYERAFVNHMEKNNKRFWQFWK